MRRTRLACFAMLAASLLLAAPARADDAPPDPVVAQRGTVTLTASQVHEMLQMTDPETRAQLQHDPNLLMQRVRDRLLQLVLLDKASSDKWDQRPEIAYRAKLAAQSTIAESYLVAQVPSDPNFPTDKEIAAAYEANKSKLMLPRQYHLAQLLVAVPQGGTGDADAHAQKHAAELRKQIVDDHKDFNSVARQTSDDKTVGTNGGDLGWVREDSLVPPIRAALAALTPGGVSEPVRTPDGWHLLKLIAVKPAGQATLAEARDTLIRAMRQERLVQGQRRYVADLLQREPMQINQVELWKQTAQ